MLTWITLSLALASSPTAPRPETTAPVETGLVDAGAPAVLATFQEEQEEEPKRPEDLPIDERPDKRAEVKELLGVFKDHVGKSGKEDDLAMAVIDDLLREFNRSGPKDRFSIVKELGASLTVRRKDLAEDVPDEALQEHAAQQLGKMGPESGPILLKNVDHKNLQGKLKAHRAVILALGKTQEPKGVKVLVKMLDDFEAYVRAAGVQALGSYVDAEEQVRKDIVEEVLKAMVPLADQLEVQQADTGDRQEVQRYYNAMRAPAKRTLEAMTGNEEADFFDWRSWWNDNKRERWSS